MSYNRKNWRRSGKAVIDLVSWALKPVIFIIFVILNWENLLPVIGFLVHGAVALGGGQDFFTPEETRYLLLSTEQFFGTAVIAICCYYGSEKLLKHVPYYTFEGEKERRVQEELNRIRYWELMRNTLTLDKIEMYKHERERDRRLIAEMREAARNVKLELETLRAIKPESSKKPASKDISSDLFSTKKAATPKRAPKRFVPRKLRKKPTPEF